MPDVTRAQGLAEMCHVALRCCPQLAESLLSLIRTSSANQRVEHDPQQGGGEGHSPSTSVGQLDILAFRPW